MKNGRPLYIGFASCLLVLSVLRCTERSNHTETLVHDMDTGTSGHDTTMPKGDATTPDGNKLPTKGDATTPDGNKLPTIKTPIPHPIFGVTSDRISNLDSIKDSLASFGRKPTVRIVFDHPESASTYASAMKSLHQVAFVMGQILDSSYTMNENCRTDLNFEERLSDFFNNSTLLNNVDIWEIGNEVNGEWLCKDDSIDVYWMIRKAYDMAKSKGKATALTLFYYSSKCTDKKHEMFNWVDKYIIEKDIRSGLDYVIISYYETACPYPDSWDQVFKKLGTRFPNSWLGFGEVGTENKDAEQNKKLKILKKYYGLKPMHPKYIGGYFWWYFRQDMVPKTKELWSELDKYSTIWNTLYPSP